MWRQWHGPAEPSYIALSMLRQRSHAWITMCLHQLALEQTLHGGTHICSHGMALLSWQQQYLPTKFIQMPQAHGCTTKVAVSVQKAV